MKHFRMLLVLVLLAGSFPVTVWGQKGERPLRDLFVEYKKFLEIETDTSFSSANRERVKVLRENLKESINNRLKKEKAELERLMASSSQLKEEFRRDSNFFLNSL